MRGVMNLRWLLCSMLALGCAREAPLVEPASAAPTPAAVPADDPTLLRLVEVAPGIYAALQPEARRFFDGNAAVVVTSAGLVVIDGPQRLAALQWLHARAEALAPPSAARHVLVTTHWHLDHSLGSALLRAWLQAEGLTVEHWGHAGLGSRLATEGRGQLEEHRAELPPMLERGAAMSASGRLEDGTPLQAAELEQLDAELIELRTKLELLAELELRPPTHAVEALTVLEIGEVTLELIPLQAHTDADLVVHIPAAGVLITGDVLDEIPFGGHGQPRRWLAALEQLKALDPTIIIPGHGPVLGPEHLDRMIALWEALIEQAALAIERGETAEQRYAAWQATPGFEAVRKELVTDSVSERNFARFMPESLARTIADLRGELEPTPH